MSTYSAAIFASSELCMSVMTGILNLEPISPNIFNASRSPMPVKLSNLVLFAFL